MQNSQLIWAGSSIASIIRGHGGLTIRKILTEWSPGKKSSITSHLVLWAKKPWILRCRSSSDLSASSIVGLYVNYFQCHDFYLPYCLSIYLLSLDITFEI